MPWGGWEEARQDFWNCFAFRKNILISLLKQIGRGKNSRTWLRSAAANIFNFERFTEVRETRPAQGSCGLPFLPWYSIPKPLLCLVHSWKELLVAAAGGSWPVSGAPSKAGRRSQAWQQPGLKIPLPGVPTSPLCATHAEKADFLLAPFLERE